MGSYYYINGSKSDIPEDEYIQAILSIAKKQGVEITDNMILQEVENSQKKIAKGDVWDATRRKKLIKALEGIKGIWANDKDFEKRQKKREKIEIEAVKKMKKAW
jgi:hypothetical protein